MKKPKTFVLGFFIYLFAHGLIFFDYVNFKS